MPDWLSEVTGDEEELAGFDFDAIQAAAAGDWMSDILGEGAEAQVETHWPDFLDKEQPAEPAEATHTPGRGDWPSWIEDMEHPESAALPEWMQADSETPEATAGEAELPVWPDEIAGEEVGIEGDVPDWMLLEGDSGGLAAVMGQSAVESEWPDWLNEVETEAAPPSSRLETPAVEAPADEAWPDWLSDLEPAESAAAPFEAAPAAEEPVPDWLADLEQAGISIEPKEDETLSADEAWPDWIGETEGEMAAPSTLPEWLAADDSQPAATDAEGGVPDWLRELEQTKNTSGLLHLAESEMAPADEAWPDWLGTVEEEIAAGTVEQPAAASEFDLGQDDGDVPMLPFDEEPVEASDWLNALAEGEAEAGPTSAAEEEWAGWSNVAEQVEPVASPAETPLAADEDELPDWLRLTEAEVPLEPAEAEATAAADEDEWPTWLRAMEPADAESAAEAEPTAGAEAAEPEEWSRWLDEQPETSSTLVTEIEPLTEQEAARPDNEFDHSWPAEEEDATAGSDWLAELEKIPELTGQELGPVPEWLRDENSTDGETTVAGDEVTDLPNWLQTDEVVEEQMIGGIDEPEKSQGEPPDDFDDAMAWLENLAAQQGAPLDELPTVQPGDAAATPSGGDDLPDWLQMDLESSPADDTDTWLQSANLVESPAEWLDLASPNTAGNPEETWLAEGPAAPSDDIPDWLRAQMPEELEQQPAAAPAGADLDWLDQMTGAGEGMEEQPTLSWDEEDEEEVSFTELAATLDEEETSLDWLAEMNQQTAAPTDLPEPALAQDTGAAGVFDFPADSDDYDFFGDLLKTEDFQMEAGEGEPASSMMMADAGEEDAMSWLEGLAAGSTSEAAEETPAEAPTLEEAPALEEPFLADLELESLDLDEDWLAESLPADTLPDEVGTKVIVAEGEVFDQLPEEPEDAMAWLEQLAAQQGAPLEELPSLLGTTDEIETEPVMPEAEVEITAADVVMEMPDDEEAAMAWLERLAAEQGAPIEELPSLMSAPPAEEVEAEPLLAEMEVEITVADRVEPEPMVMAEPAAELELEMGEDEAMAWLERLAAQQGAPLDELPSVSEADYSAIEVTVEQPEVAAESEAAMEGLQIPEDPDEAMAWLERLAAQQGAPLDELPSVTAEEYSAIEVTIEPAAELEPVAEVEWVEPAVSEVELVEAEVAVAMMEPTVTEPEAAEGEPLVSFVSLDDEVPDDPDAALAWLEQLAAEQEEPAEELPPMEVVEEPPTPAVPHSVVEARVEAEASLHTTGLQGSEPAADLVDEMPEDPEAAMAWLEQLAARQGAPLEELKSVEAMPAEAEVAMPEWVAREMAEAPEEPEMPVAEESPELDLFDAELADILAGGERSDLLLDLEELPPLEELEPAEAFQENVAAEPEPTEPAFEELDTAGIGESLPDWLSFAPAGASEGIDWIDSLVQSDVSGWLTAEEEVTGIHEEVPMMAAPEPEPMPLPRPVAAEPPPTPRLEERPERVERVERAPAFAGSLNQTQLAAARDSLSSGDFDTALEGYSTLLDSGAGLNLIIADLESAVTRYNRQPLFTRLLGDAYMRNGQLQKALDMYRRALDQL
jgi:hypothetical protein